MSHGWTVFDALERLSIVNGDAVSFTCGDRSWTYLETYQRVLRLSQAFVQLGLTKGDMVAIHSDNCHRYMEALFACARIGAVLVPISTRLKDAEIQTIVDDVQPRGVIVDKLARSPLWASERVPVVISFEPLEEPYYSYEALLVQDFAPCSPKLEVKENDPLTILYTAAVDGKPRGAVLSHRNVMAQVMQTASAYELDRTDVHGCFLPMYHTFGLYFATVAAATGIETVILTKFDPPLALHAVLHQKVTFFADFAPMAKRLLDAANEHEERLEGKIRFIVGLDTPDTIEEYLRLGTKWYGLYGQTEVSGIVATGELTSPFEQQSFAGKVMTQSKVSIRNELQESVGAGEVGEICVSGPVCTSGYYRNQGAARWTTDGWLQTGDLGRLEPDGSLYFMGRKQVKDLIKTGGENVYPVEVERVLSAHPAVQRCCVIGVPDALWRERIKAVVQLQPEMQYTTTEQELIAFCKQRIASYKCPSVVTFVDEFPLLDGGAVARDEVKRLFGEVSQA